MRFSTAWANVAKQNVTLKVVILSLSVSTVFLAIGFLKANFKAPIVVERSCETVMLQQQNTEPTVKEIKQFLNEALLERFSASSVESKYLSKNVKVEKKAENKIFAKKKIQQFAIIRSIQVTKDKMTAQVDRLFSMGKTRPAYASEFLLKIQSTKRSLKNPYGLVLVSIKTLTKDKKESR